MALTSRAHPDSGWRCVAHDGHILGEGKVDATGARQRGCQERFYALINRKIATLVNEMIGPLWQVDQTNPKSQANAGFAITLAPGPKMSLVVILIAVFVGAVWVILETRAGVRPAHDHWPLFSKPLLTERETEFYRRLEEMYPEHRIFVQVALSQLLDVLPGTSNRQSVRNQFQQLVADFVLCRRDLTVVAVIELDDSSHSAHDRQKADRRKTKAVESAGLRLVRIPAGPIPSTVELRRIIRADIDEMNAGLATSGDVLSILSGETGALLRPVLGLALLGIVGGGGWLVYSHLLATALPQLATRVHVPMAQTLLPTRVPVSAPPVSSVAVQDGQQTQKHAVAAQRAADVLAKRKQAAWAEFYKAPASCEHPPAWADQVECGNQYIRAKKEFESLWQAQLNAQQPSSASSSALVVVGR